jgi:DegV family protein with EDD domain
MKVFIIVDSNCDLPSDFIAQENIKILPAKFSINHVEEDDVRDEHRMQQLFNQETINKKNTLSIPKPSLKQLDDFFNKEIVGKCDLAIIITISKSRVDTYDDLNTCIARLHGQTKFRVIAAKVLSAGQGVMAAHCAELINNGISGSQLRQKLDHLSDDLYNYSIIPDTEYSYARGKVRGEKTTNRFMAKIGKLAKVSPIILHHKDKITTLDTKTRGVELAFEKLVETLNNQITIGLKSNIVCLSYTGNIAELEHFEYMNILRNICANNKLKLLISPMSLGVCRV